MNGLRTWVMVASLAVGVGCASSGDRGSKSLSISESAHGDGIVVAVSEALARSLLEDVVGSEIECGAELDDEFSAMLAELDREGRGGRATLRGDDGVLTARRSGSSLKMTFRAADGEGRLEVRMPWAVAECLVDGSASLSSRDAGRIEVRVVGADGGSFELAVR
jgi:hypothetical protein